MGTVCVCVCLWQLAKDVAISSSIWFGSKFAEEGSKHVNCQNFKSRRNSS